MSGRRSEEQRRAETQCSVCLRIVGLMHTSWNHEHGGPPVWKTSKHHGQDRRWCPGGGVTVSAGRVIPKKVAG